MLQVFGELDEFVVAEVEVHQAGDEGELRNAAVFEIVEGHVEFLETFETPFFEVDFFYGVVGDVDLLDSRQLPQFLERNVVF